MAVPTCKWIWRSLEQLSTDLEDPRVTQRIVKGHGVTGHMKALPLNRTVLVNRLAENEVTPDELHDILQQRLTDLDTFASALKRLITDPQRLGLQIA